MKLPRFLSHSHVVDRQHLLMVGERGKIRHGTCTGMERVDGVGGKRTPTRSDGANVPSICEGATYAVAT